MVGYFAMTEAPDGRIEKVVNDGELAECFKIASPKEWPGGSPVMPSGTTRDQFWAALPKLGKSPSDYGLTARSDLEPSEIWRRVSARRTSRPSRRRTTCWSMPARSPRRTSCCAERS